MHTILSKRYCGTKRSSRVSIHTCSSHLILQVEVKVNMGKDFSRNTVEISGRTDPGSFIAFSGMDYEMYAKGTNTFITEEDVSRGEGGMG